MKVTLSTILMAAVVAGSTSAQSASDDFNRPNAGTPGPDWVVDDGVFEIESNQGKANNRFFLGFMHHATLTGDFADSTQSVDFIMNGFGGDFIGLVAGLNPSTWSAVETKLQDNDGDGLFDRLFFNSAINAGGWDGSSLFFDLATPIASGTMTLSFTNSGDTAVVTIDSIAGGTETFQGTGINSFTFPVSGDTFGISSFGDSWFDNWSCDIGPTGPVYSITNLTAGQLATFSVSNLTLGDAVTFAYSLAGAGPTTTPFGVADMSAPINVLASASADVTGVASVGLTVPSGAAGVTLYTQALVVTTSTLTNSLIETVL